MAYKLLGISPKLVLRHTNGDKHTFHIKNSEYIWTATNKAARDTSIRAIENSPDYRIYEIDS